MLYYITNIEINYFLYNYLILKKKIERTEKKSNTLYNKNINKNIYRIYLKYYN